MEYWMLPSVFVPVSEDSEGVYYQATSGFRIYRGTMGQTGRSRRTLREQNTQ